MRKLLGSAVLLARSRGMEPSPSEENKASATNHPQQQVDKPDTSIPENEIESVLATGVSLVPEFDFESFYNCEREKRDCDQITSRVKLAKELFNDDAREFKAAIDRVRQAYKGLPAQLEQTAPVSRAGVPLELSGPLLESATLQWPLFHRILTRVAENPEMDSAGLVSVINMEVKLFTQLSDFLVDVDKKCSCIFQTEICKGRYETFVKKQETVGGTAAAFFHKLAEVAESGQCAIEGNKHGAVTRASLGTMNKLQIFNIDPDWPTDSPDFPVSDSRTGATEIKWLHLPYVILQDPQYTSVSLFGEIRPSQVEQGAVGTCWLLSSASCVAQSPDQIRQLFVTQTEQAGLGMYKVLLFVNGKVEEVEVNDLVPCAKVDGKWKPLVAHSSDNSMWVSLLEKAAAKYHKGYANIHGGDPFKAFSMFNNKLTLQFIKGEHQSWNDLTHDWKVSEFSQVLENFAEVGYPMTASCTSTDTLCRDGIKSSHAFSVLGFAKLPFGSELITLVKIRNPWGNDASWTGDFSQTSAVWKVHQHAFMTLKVKNDGILWISMSDFLDIFSEIHVSCRLSAHDCPILHLGKSTLPSLKRKSTLNDNSAVDEPSAKRLENK